MTPLTLECRHLPGITVISVVGELDWRTAGKLEVFIGQARQNPADQLILDLAGLSFLDSIGVRVLLTTYTNAVAHGGTVHLAALQPTPARLIDITGVRTAVPVHLSVADALNAATP